MISLPLELKEAGYRGDPATFVDLMVEVYRVSPPRWTADELTLRPDDAIRFCNRVRRKAGCRRVQDHAILSALIGVRKNTRRLTAIPRRHATSPVRAQRILRDRGYDWDDFLALILDTMRNLCPNWNDQELLFRPSEAIKVCASVRHRSRQVDLDDRTILGVLANSRKRSMLSWKKAR